MKISINRSEVDISVAQLTIESEGIRYRIVESIEGGLRINKMGIIEDRITVLPHVSNEVTIK